ncbi:SRPBCC domain-containing protein [uncultured Abyssibacter sp.]|uniref:SRPBCC domain-containing protein n=1 Tax=uncultured Abyssibacter sp. TaxID=2320202 RepID=UPI0032B1715C
MSETTTESGVFRITIDAPIDKVWAELTRTDMVLPFFFGAKCETTPGGLQPGAPMRMRSPDGRHTSVVGEVLEFDPPHRYSHTFRFTNLDDPECKVTYELKDVGGKTEFTLTNENVPAGTKTAKYMQQGGQFIIANLKAVVETGKPTFGGRLILAMIAISAPFAPKSTRSENWPL